MRIDQEKFEKMLAKACSETSIRGYSFQLEDKGGTNKLKAAAGNLSVDSRFYVASINKLFTSALIHRYVEQSILSLDDKIATYLPAYLSEGILKFSNKDYSSQITIAHLLSHTSGLPCYLIDKRPDGKKNMDMILGGEDQAWPMEKVIEEVREMKSKFPPGSKGKANYSETNYRLLDCIIEQITNKSIDQVLSELFSELGMESSFVLTSENAVKCSPVYYQNRQVSLLKYWDTSRHDIASTSSDLIIFLKAFFEGHFFPKVKLNEMKSWNNIFFPFKYGIGIQKFHIPRILAPFTRVPEIIGHSGSVATIAYYVPERNIFISGTVNQAAKKQKPFQIMMKVIHQI